MRVLEKRSRLSASADEVYRWHARAGAFERLSPPWDRPRVESRTGGVEQEGARVVLRVGPLHQRWVAEHYGAEPGRAFRDRQVQGPFAAWNHEHRMEPEPAGGCTLVDRVEYALPGGALGDALAAGFVRTLLERTFAYRHRVTAGDLAAHAGCRGERAMKVAITGASGLVGTALLPFLTTGGHEVVRLVRRPARGRDEARWDPERGELDRGALDGVEAVVHLAGANIAEGRWTNARKRELRDSRLGPTRRLAEALASLPRPPKVLVSSSATGYYGERADAWLDETEPPAADFLGSLAREWEEATGPAAAAGIRVVRLRTGIVLTPQGGALGKMLLPFKLGVGGVLGSGLQHMSWIAIDDVLDVIHFAMTTTALDGPVNAVSPEPATNREFTKTLGRVLGRPTVAPAPAFALRLAFGEMADATLLVSTRVRPRRLLDAGYRFRFPRLEDALRHLLGEPRA